MPVEVADRNRDWGGAIKSYNSQEMLTRSTPHKHGLAALLLPAPIKVLAILGLMAFLTTVETLTPGIIQHGIGESRMECSPPQLPHLATRSPVRGGVGTRGWNLALGLR